MARTDAQGRRLCTATTRAGNPCRSPAISGGMVCRMHGGSSPQAKEAAHRVVLADLLSPALLLLRDALTDGKVPMAVRVSAARVVLDKVAADPYATIPPEAVFERWIADLEAEAAGVEGRMGSSNRS